MSRGRDGFNGVPALKVITEVASLAEEAGSMVALGFFNLAIAFAKFRHFMRLFIVCATSLIGNGSFDRAREAMRIMDRSFAEIGRLV
ncbi:pentatricopeptide repeat-containing protein At4g19890-like [Hevea brasiliensis]|uniref:pentatricopeptide repeat-containing protein At4g19890-like n=1 Tax=Hevea brasiliensis TaxID=3981 RepID=UPI0025E3A720|nr:pentatricopeptide repeat-containing protein At4g19890-like [Hevea brasiliensis]